VISVIRSSYKIPGILLYMSVGPGTILS
jgi:hypothetical protein